MAATFTLPSPAILMVMSIHHSPLIVSFVIRFVVEEQPDNAPTRAPYHGSIRHVQSDEVIHFNGWRDAVDFIRRYVPLEVESSS